MKSSLNIFLEKLGLLGSSDLFFKNDKVSFTSFLRGVDYDAVYILEDSPLIVFKEYGNSIDFNNNFKSFQKDIWNINRVSIIFVVLPTRVLIYNARIFEEKDSVLDFFDIDESFDFSGDFFNKYLERFDNSKSVYNCLLGNIRKTISLLSDEGLPVSVIHDLIIKLIFSVYLVDRGVFKEDFFISRYGCEFKEIILDKFKLFDFFEFLKGSFGGDLFNLSIDEGIVSDLHLKHLYNLFIGVDVAGGSGVVLCPYDFGMIPVDLISNIYEIFLNGDVVYTPIFLVDYILDKEFQTNFRVLDPSCGSGVFLTSSLKRLFDDFIKTNSDYVGSDLSNILVDNIFGIDINEDAISISILSIYLTLLDYLDVSEIGGFKLPSLLGSNFFVDDFFNLSGGFNDLGSFDFIVGNPPVGSGNSYYDVCGDISESFLLRVRDFASSSSRVAFLVSNKTLYDPLSSDFRKYFLSNFHLSEVLEFSRLSSEIFNGNSDSSAVVFYDMDLGSVDKVRHVSLKPNKLFYLLSSVVIQKQDVTYVSREDLIGNDWIWKVLLFGNVLDFNLVRGLFNKLNIKDLIEKYDLSLISGGDSGVLVGSSLDSDYDIVSFFNETSNLEDVFYSISGEDRVVLSSVFAFLNSRFFTYFAFLTFSSVGVGDAKFSLAELGSVPVVVDSRFLTYVDELLCEDSNYELILAKIDDLVFDLLGFNNMDMELVDYLFDVSIPMLKGEDVYYNVSYSLIKEYVDIFIEHFGNYFSEDDGEFINVEYYEHNQFICLRFVISNKKSRELIEFKNRDEVLSFFANISLEDRDSLYVEKDVKGFDEDSFYVIKSDEFKNWHNAVARRDLIEFMNSLTGGE